MNHSEINRRSMLQGLAVLGGGLMGAAQAQTAQTARTAWPGKPVRVVVPFNAGGATDIIARTVGEALSQRIGQPVVIDNKGGAAGILGTDAVAKAAPDGHTLLVSLSTSMLINQFLYTKLPYDPQKDLALVSQIAAAPVTLVVHPSVGANDMKELLAYARANKGKLSYGSWGTGSYAHLAGAYMSKTTGSDMTHSAYKGEAPMIQDLIGGQLQFCFSSALNTKPFIEAGQLGDGALSPADAAVVDADRAVVAGHAPPSARVALSQERIVGAGFLALMNSPDEFRRNYQRDMPVWKALVEAADAKLD